MKTACYVVLTFLLSCQSKVHTKNVTYLAIRSEYVKPLDLIIEDAKRKLDSSYNSRKSDFAIVLKVRKDNLGEKICAGFLILDKKEVGIFFSYPEESVFGCFDYEDKTVFVSGDGADICFFKTKEEKIVDYIQLESGANPDDSFDVFNPPIIFEPIINTYRIENGIVTFIEERYY